MRNPFSSGTTLPWNWSPILALLVRRSDGWARRVPHRRGLSCSSRGPADPRQIFLGDLPVFSSICFPSLIPVGFPAPPERQPSVGMPPPPSCQMETVCYLGDGWHMAHTTRFGVCCSSVQRECLFHGHTHTHTHSRTPLHTFGWHIRSAMTNHVAGFSSFPMQTEASSGLSACDNRAVES